MSKFIWILYCLRNDGKHFSWCIIFFSSLFYFILFYFESLMLTLKWLHQKTIYILPDKSILLSLPKKFKTDKSFGSKSRILNGFHRPLTVWHRSYMFSNHYIRRKPVLQMGNIQIYTSHIFIRRNKMHTITSLHSPIW